MELIKTIKANNKIKNIFTYENEPAQVELINLLKDKLQNNYKIKLQFDHIKREIKAELKFVHEHSNGQKTKYLYIYYFYNINNNINLY